ncbi:MAG: hypothetical protein WC370_01885 [Dehalococcoidales bacterium]
MDEKPLYRTGILDNPAFQGYVRGLPETHLRLVQLPDGRVISITQTGDEPPEVRRMPPQNKDRKGETQSGISQ